MTPAGGTDGGALRPRYPRIAALGGSVAVTLVSVLGGVGALQVAGTPYAEARLVGDERARTTPPGAEAGRTDDAVTRLLHARRTELAGGSPAPTGAGPGNLARADREPELPARSGAGRRVVFSMAQQRVWLVDAEEEVERTYPVSGSVYDNLDPGTYDVYSRSEHATGIDGSQLRYMVRFTRGANAAIGFHNIPRVDGRRVQTRDELGTPLSHGCIRQWADDAKALWRFAPEGTTVVVVT